MHEAFLDLSLPNVSTTGLFSGVIGETIVTMCQFLFLADAGLDLKENSPAQIYFRNIRVKKKKTLIFLIKK